MLHLFSLNGAQLKSTRLKEHLYTMKFSADGQYLMTGGERVIIRTVSNLQVTHKFKKLDGAIRSLELTPDEQHILVGLQTGELCIWALNEQYLRKRFLVRLGNL